MEKNNNELTKVNENIITKFLKKISSFFINRNTQTENNEKSYSNNKRKETNQNSFKAELSSDYNELQRLNAIREKYERDNTYIKNISTEDLIKITEMNNREIQELEEKIKIEKSKYSYT